MWPRLNRVLRPPPLSKNFDDPNCLISTAFVFFAEAMRERAKNEMPNAEPADVAAAIKQEWAVLSEDQKAMYVQMAAKERAEICPLPIL